jgi:hypothetical protein
MPQALSKYKKNAGLEIDPQTERRAEQIYEEGMALFDRGQLQPSLPKFEVSVSSCASLFCSVRMSTSAGERLSNGLQCNR